MSWNYEARVGMGFFSGKGDDMKAPARSTNGHARDTRNPDGARHAAVTTPNLDAVRTLRSGTDGYEGRHRS
jgi:hypothetical protein